MYGHVISFFTDGKRLIISCLGVLVCPSDSGGCSYIKPWSVNSPNSSVGKEMVHFAVPTTSYANRLPVCLV